MRIAQRIWVRFIPALALLMALMTAGAEQRTIRATILYDNYDSREGCKADWGFACLIEGTEKTILFDAGTQGDILLHNVERLQVDLSKVQAVVISHTHEDHTGGLVAALGRIGKVPVYLPYSSPPELVKLIAGAGAQVIRRKEPVSISGDAMLTGEMGNEIREQSLILKSARGLVVVTGCSHPGIVEILERAKELGRADIHMVFGGFHLLRHSAAEVEKIIAGFRELGVRNVGATHCTGDEAIAIFRKDFGPNYVKLGVGSVYSLTTP